MDGTRFDVLIKRLTTTRLTRGQTLRGLAAAGVAALTGVDLSARDVRAKKGDVKKRRVCVCAGIDPATCDTKKKPTKRVRRILRRNACAYRGRCSGVSGCAGPVVRAVCEGVPNFTPCGDGRGCIGGLCVETCGAVVTAGPPARARFSIQDDEGVVEILVTRSENADTVVPAFTLGTTAPIEVTSTKINQTLPARIEMRITDAAGNVRTCDVTF